MRLRQFHTQGLGCYSYLVGDEMSGEAAIIDPGVSVDGYIDAAREEGLHIAYIMETHLHADHLSGARALAARTGAVVCLSSDAHAGFPHEKLQEGSDISLGLVRLRARQTPGHTPEHLAFEVYDLARQTDRPYALLTGDALFVGSLGRPDLVMTTRAVDLAALLFETAHDVLRTGFAGTLVLPGHGEGSACGARMSGLAWSTLGYENETNPFLLYESREAFVQAITADLPPKPGNASNLKYLNQDGPPAYFPKVSEIPPLAPRPFAAAVGQGLDALILDCRAPDAFASDHVPGAISVPVEDPAFSNRAAVFLEWNLPCYLVLPDTEGAAECVLSGLQRVGGLDVRGLLSGGMDAWRDAGLPLAGFAAMGAPEAKDALDIGDATLLDVRSRAEWLDGHVEDAVWFPWEEAAMRAEAFDPAVRYIVMCGSGSRSSTAASVLQRHGLPRIVNLLGGMTAWTNARFPTTVGEPPELGPALTL